MLNNRRRQELLARPIADAVYYGIYPSLVDIERFDDATDERHLLDREHAIDAKLTFKNGQIMTMQEKFLSAEYARYRSLTVEYEQNQHTHEHGDWFKIASQLYFVGYLTPDAQAFSIWMLVDFARLIHATQEGRVIWQQNANKDGRAKASFCFTRFDNIPMDCVIARQL
jgi:hypothetical protein